MEEEEVIEEIPKYRDSQRWCRRGNYFYMGRVRGQTTTWRCSFDGCISKWRQRDGQVPTPLLAPHGHEPQPWIPERHALFMRLRERVTADAGSKLSSIYEELAAQYPLGAMHLPYKVVESSMRRWRSDVLPAIPRTVEEYGTAIRADETYSARVVGEVSVNGVWAIALAMPEFGECLRQSTTVFADSTLKVPSPLGAAHLLILHCAVEGRYFHPVCILMGNRSRTLYYAALDLVWQAAGIPRPERVVADFEEALSWALQGVTGVTPEGCYFHFCQVLMKQAASLGLLIQRGSPAYDMVRLYCALALMPAALIPAEDIANAKGLPLTPEFDEYFVAHWMERVGPQRFSIHGSPHRATKVCEGFHTKLTNLLSSNPNVWQFTAALTRMMSTSTSQYRRLCDAADRARFSRNRVTTYVKNKLLKAQTKALERGKISPRDFLCAVAGALHWIPVFANVAPEAPDKTEASDSSEAPDQLDVGLVVVVGGGDNLPDSDDDS